MARNNTADWTSWIACAIWACLCVNLSGCTTEAWQQDPPATMALPPDPVCHILNAGQIEPLLPPAAYTHEFDVTAKFTYVTGLNALQGRCVLKAEDSSDATLLLISTITDTLPFRSQQCNGPRLNLETTIGDIESSASCATNGTTTSAAWAKYFGGNFGGMYSNTPSTTIIHASVTSREGRDSVADATQLVQWIIDYMESSYQAALVSDTPPPPPRSVQAVNTRDTATVDCLADWFTTTATPDVTAKALDSNILTQDSTTGHYQIDQSFDDVQRWARDDVYDPWSESVRTIRSGVACPYTPVDRAMPSDPTRVQTTTECFQLWLNRVHNAQAIINSGLATGILTHNPATGRYDPNPSHVSFLSWTHDNEVPWTEIITETIYGSGKCGYPE